MAKRFRTNALINDSLVAQYRIALKVNRFVERYSTHDIVLDLENAEWFTPTFLAPVSEIYNQAARDGTQIKIKYPPHLGVQSYLSQIGFPEGSLNPTDKYDNSLPLCKMDPESGPDTFEIVGRKIRKLVKKQLADTMWSDLQMGVVYPLNELIDNVDYHSDCNLGILLVQYYPKKESLDICIVDDGISIPGSYEGYGKDFESDVEAIRLAAEEGISTRPDTGMERGFGLRTTVEMICSGLNGQVLISSRDGTIFRDGSSNSSAMLSDYSWDGTIFAARLNIPDNEFHYFDYIYPE